MKRATLILVTALFAVSQLAAQAMAFTDARGTVISMPGKATRVVSLSPALTEMLFASGGGKNVVGVTSYCNFPAEADALPSAE